MRSATSGTLPFVLDKIIEFVEIEKQSTQYHPGDQQQQDHDINRNRVPESRRYIKTKNVGEARCCEQHQPER